jgi:hypothetical protein
MIIKHKHILSSGGALSPPMNSTTRCMSATAGAGSCTAVEVERVVLALRLHRRYLAAPLIFVAQPGRVPAPTVPCQVLARHGHQSAPARQRRYHLCRRVDEGVAVKTGQNVSSLFGTNKILCPSFCR